MSLEPSEELLAAVDGIGTTTWGGSTWRHTAPNRNPLSGEGARLFGGRWNPPDLASTLYLSTNDDGCIAEFRRMAAGQGKGPASFLPRRISQLDVTGVEVVDLRLVANQQVVGLEVDDLTSDDWSACQLVGAAAHFLRADGLIAPSATALGDTLVLFEGRLDGNAVKVIDSYVMPALTT